MGDGRGWGAVVSTDPVFEYAVGLVLESEGGLNLNPQDRGNYRPDGVLVGTKYGISAASYPQLDIPALTWDEAKAIYRRDFWETLPPGLDVSACIVAFDIAVNNGPGRLKRWVLEGNNTAVKLIARRLEHYTELDDWPTWGKGWVRRAGRLLVGAEAYQVSPFL